MYLFTFGPVANLLEVKGWLALNLDREDDPQCPETEARRQERPLVRLARYRDDVTIRFHQRHFLHL